MFFNEITWIIKTINFMYFVFLSYVFENLKQNKYKIACYNEWINSHAQYLILNMHVIFP